MHDGAPLGTMAQGTRLMAQVAAACLVLYGKGWGTRVMAQGATASLILYGHAVSVTHARHVHGTCARTTLDKALGPVRSRMRSCAQGTAVEVEWGTRSQGWGSDANRVRLRIRGTVIHVPIRIATSACGLCQTKLYIPLAPPGM